MKTDFAKVKKNSTDVAPLTWRFLCFSSTKNDTKFYKKSGDKMGFSLMMELLQKKNKNKIVICNLGNFYISVGKDAVLLNKLLNLKVSCFKPEICKVGFPIVSG